MAIGRKYALRLKIDTFVFLIEIGVFNVHCFFSNLGAYKPLYETPLQLLRVFFLSVSLCRITRFLTIKKIKKDFIKGTAKCIKHIEYGYDDQ